MKKLTKEDKRDISTYLKQEKLKLGNNCDAKDGISRLNEKIKVYEKKFEMSSKRKEYTRTNNEFELHRGRFTENWLSKMIQQ
ncbi:hypothetical protein BDAP_001948 [Binucleata daphniae]